MKIVQCHNESWKYILLKSLAPTPSDLEFQLENSTRGQISWSVLGFRCGLLFVRQYRDMRYHYYYLLSMIYREYSTKYVYVRLLGVPGPGCSS